MGVVGYDRYHVAEAWGLRRFVGDKTFETIMKKGQVEWIPEDPHDPRAEIILMQRVCGSGGSKTINFGPFKTTLMRLMGMQKFRLVARCPYIKRQTESYKIKLHLTDGKTSYKVARLSWWDLKNCEDLSKFVKDGAQVMNRAIIDQTIYPRAVFSDLYTEAELEEEVHRRVVKRVDEAYMAGREAGKKFARSAVIAAHDNFEERIKILRGDGIPTAPADKTVTLPEVNPINPEKKSWAQVTIYDKPHDHPTIIEFWASKKKRKSKTNPLLGNRTLEERMADLLPQVTHL